MVGMTFIITKFTCTKREEGGRGEREREREEK
jgi:hypothetical protein